MMAQQGKKVLLIGCDPKSDTTSLLFGGRACPTIIETSTKKKLAGDQVQIGDVCFKRDGVFAMELGGPEDSMNGDSISFFWIFSETSSAVGSACRSPATCARR
jgi:nitrogenase subunit NifH